MATRTTAVTPTTPANEVNSARQTLYQQFMNVTHRDYTIMVNAFRQSMLIDPDFVARACVHLLSGGTAIRDQQDGAIITLLQAPHQFHEYRDAGRALLLGNDVYKITVNGQPAKVRGLPAFRIIRILDFLATDALKVPRLRKRITRDWLGYLQADLGRLDYVALHNRVALKRLYEREHMHPNEHANALLFNDDPPTGTQLWAVRQIARETDPIVKAKLIIQHKIPYRIAATIAPKTNPAIAMALIEVMTSTEAVNSRAWIEKGGLLNTPEVKKAYLAKVGQMRGGVASAMHRASAQGGDEEVQAVMDAAVQQTIEKGERIKSNLLLLVDRSGSMEKSIEAAKEFGYRIAPLVDGQIRVVVYNEYATPITVPDQFTLKGWQAAFKTVMANGGTNTEAGFNKGIENGFQPQAIVIVSDGADHRGDFVASLRRYTDQTGIAPRVGMVRVAGEADSLSARIDAEKRWEFDRLEFVGDYYVFDQMAHFLGGPAAKGFVERIMDVQLPVIEGLA